ncbi:methyl-accepting chemotaxis protein [Pseudomonas wadenswilerensis]
MLTNLPLRYKLLLILILPLSGFLILSTTFIASNFKTHGDMQATVDASATAQTLSQLITTLQRERGASGVFIGSAGKSMGDRLSRMRQDSDIGVRALAAMQNSDTKKLLGSLEELELLRSQVDKLAITSTVSGERYTAIIQALIGFTHKLESHVSDPSVIRALGALNQFIELKERAGRERVLLGLVFSQDHFDANLLSRFSRNLGEYSAYSEGFRLKVPASLLDQYEARLQTSAASDVSRLQRMAFEVPLGQSLAITPEAWFETSTQRIDQMSEVEKSLAQNVGALAQEALERASQALWLTLIGALVALLVVALLSWVIIRRIGSAVLDINATLNGLSNRDLTVRTHYRSRDEFGQIADNLDRMAREMTSVVEEIGSATTQVATAAEESSAVTLQTSRSVEQQRMSTESVATAINEMSATVRDVAHSTSDAADLSQQVHASSAQGREEIEGTIELIRELSGQAEQTASIIEDLKQESDAITSVLDVIRDIADQTNLLALNAAIEAARAGDHGRGFAVVATEVRTLAQRTQESTGSIQQMISNLQSGSDRANASMLETLGKAQEGAQRIGRAGELLEKITEGVANISDRTLQIASAVEEQSAVSEDINRNVNEINDLVIQVSAGAQQTAVTSQELARLAEHQQQLVSRFKVA